MKKIARYHAIFFMQIFAQYYYLDEIDWDLLYAKKKQPIETTSVLKYKKKII